MTKFPCTPDCQKRAPGCHSKCQAYLDAKTESDRVRAARRRESEDNDYHIKAALKNRYKGIKEKM